MTLGIFVQSWKASLENKHRGLLVAGRGGQREGRCREVMDKYAAFLR